MTTAQTFAEDPLSFMNSNVVLTRAGGVGGARSFTFQAAPDAFGRTRRNRQIPVWNLVPYARNDDDRLLAYWCPFEENYLCGVVLRNAAAVMFTAEMSGCTFGVGSPATDGSVLAMHVNLRLGTGKPTDNYTAQRRAILDNSGGHAFIMEPLAYMPSEDSKHDVSVTTFGFRRDGVWRFYYQKNRRLRQGHRTEYQIRRVTPITHRD